MNILQQQLLLLGISEGSVKLFPILKNNPDGISVLRLSKLMNVPRSTIYGYINELVEKGLVKKGLKEERSLYFPESKEKILLLFAEQEDLIESAKEIITQDWSEEVKQLHKPGFFIYEGSEAYKSIFRDLLSEKPDVLYVYWPINSMFDFVPEEDLRDYHRKRVKSGTEVRVLWPQSKKISKKRFNDLFYGDEKYNLREIRLLPKGIDHTIGYMIYGNKVAFISSNKEQYGFVINSHDLAISLRSQFQYIWKQSKKY